MSDQSPIPLAANEEELLTKMKENPPTTLWRLYSHVRIAAHFLNWRIGQALFNVLAVIRPDISEALRATDKDPFYAGDYTDPRWEAAVTYIEAHWGDNGQQPG